MHTFRLYIYIYIYIYIHAYIVVVPKRSPTRQWQKGERDLRRKPGFLETCRAEKSTGSNHLICRGVLRTMQSREKQGLTYFNLQGGFLEPIAPLSLSIVSITITVTIGTTIITAIEIAIKRLRTNDSNK